MRPLAGTAVNSHIIREWQQAICERAHEESARASIKPSVPQLLFAIHCLRKIVSPQTTIATASHHLSSRKSIRTIPHDTPKKLRTSINPGVRHALAMALRVARDSQIMCYGSHSSCTERAICADNLRVDISYLAAALQNRNSSGRKQRWQLEQMQSARLYPSGCIASGVAEAGKQ